MSEREYSGVILGNIRNAIRDSGLKQRAVAERCGLTEMQFSDLLCGRRVLRAEFIPRIAAALGVGVDTLYEARET